MGDAVTVLQCSDSHRVAEGFGGPDSRVDDKSEPQQPVDKRSPGPPCGVAGASKVLTYADMLRFSKSPADEKHPGRVGGRPPRNGKE